MDDAELTRPDDLLACLLPLAGRYDLDCALIGWIYR